MINSAIRKEMVAQGHHLSGEMENSLDADTRTTSKATETEGYAVFYAQILNEGYPASSASYKQVPFLIDYFKQRGYDEKDAKSFAFATISKWMKEGMPTQASKRFSKTGSRTNLIESAFLAADVQIDDYMNAGLDFVIEEEFQKEKSETI